MESRLIISACGKANEVCIALKTLVKTFGRNVTLAEIDYQIRFSRLDSIIKKQLKNKGGKR